MTIKRKDFDEAFELYKAKQDAVEAFFLEGTAEATEKYDECKEKYEKKFKAICDYTDFVTANVAKSLLNAVGYRVSAKREWEMCLNVMGIEVQ